MIKLRHNTLILLSGLLWLAVGASLLTLGVKLIVGGIDQVNLPLFNFLQPWVGNFDYAAIVLIALALAIGQLKGKFVFRKTVKRVVSRIHSLPNPASLTKVYGLPYLFLIIFMILLGMSMRYFGLSPDIRGVVDLAVGAALIQGSTLYFRSMGQTSTCDN